MQAVEDALAAGIDRFSYHDRDNMKDAMKDLRLGNALAKEILDACARKTFQGFITRSRSTRNRLDAAKELKRLVFYSNIVVAPLLEDVKVNIHPDSKNIIFLFNVIVAPLLEDLKVSWQPNPMKYV